MDDTLSEGGFERVRRTAGLFLGPAAFLGVLFLRPAGMTAEGHRLLAVFALVVVLWITEAIPIPITALFGSVLAVALGVAPARDVFAPYGDPIIFLFIGSFIIARAMTVHGLDRRFAGMVLRRKESRRSFWRLLFSAGVISALLSMWMSNTAVAAMLMPFIFCMLKPIAGEGGTGDALIGSGALMVAYCASIGGIATPVGTPPNLITLALLDRTAGVRIPFFHWMLVGVPLSISLACALYLIMRVRWRKVGEGARMVADSALCARVEPRLSRGEANTLAVFCLVATLWVLPGAVAISLGTDHPFRAWLDARVPESAAAVLGAVLLFVLPVDWRARRFTLSWHEASRIDWGTILLFGGGLSLGALIASSGLGRVLGERLVHITGRMSLSAFTLVAVVGAIVLTEFMSNTAAATIVVPIVIAAARAFGHPILPPVLGACFGASMAFMMPVSTPPNAIAYATGFVRIRRMIATGIALDAVAAVIILLVLRLYLAAGLLAQ